MKRISLSVLVTAVCLFFVAQANATYIRSAASTTSSVGDAVPAANMSNQSGLASTFINGVTDFDVYNPGSVTHDYPWANEWFAPLGTDVGSVTFDLGYVFTIDKFAFWNEDSGGVAGIDAFSSIDGSSWSLLLGTYAPTNTTLDSAYVADVFKFSTVARYVRFDMTAITPTDQGYLPTLAVGEVAFSVAEAVPEPATMLLFGAGMGVFGLFRGRKKKEA